MALDETKALTRLIQAKENVVAPTESTATGPVREESTLTKLVKKQADQEIAKVSEKEGLAQQELQLQKQAQEQEVRGQERRLNEASLNMRSQFQEKVNALLTDLEQRKADISYGRDKMRAEQASFIYRLSSDQYMSKLKSEGARSRLDSTIRFKEELLDSIFSSKKDLATNQINARESLFEDDLSFKSMLKADDRTFSNKLNKMSIDQAWALFNQESSNMVQATKDGIAFGTSEAQAGRQFATDSLDDALSAASEAAAWTAVGNIGSAAIQGYGAYQSSQVDAAKRGLLSTGKYSANDLASMTEDDILSQYNFYLGGK